MRTCTRYANLFCQTAPKTIEILRMSLRTSSMIFYAVTGLALINPFRARGSMRGLPAAAMPGNKQTRSILPLPKFQLQALLPMMPIRLCLPQQRHKSCNVSQPASHHTHLDAFVQPYWKSGQQLTNSLPIRMTYGSFNVCDGAPRSDFQGPQLTDQFFPFFPLAERHCTHAILNQKNELTVRPYVTNPDVLLPATNTNCATWRVAHEVHNSCVVPYTERGEHPLSQGGHWLRLRHESADRGRFKVLIVNAYRTEGTTNTTRMC